MAIKRVSRFRHETALYFLFCDQVMKEVADELGLTRIQVVTFLWVFYINKYIFKNEWIYIDKTIDVIREIDPSYVRTRKTILLTLDKLVAQGLLNKISSHYMLDDAAKGVLQRFTSRFANIAYMFDNAVSNPEVKLLFPKRRYTWYTHHKRKKHYKKRKKNVKKETQPKII